MQPLQIALVPDRARLIVSLVGEIDLFTATAVDDVARSAVRDGWGHLVLDLRRVRFMDSAGVHLLERLARSPAGVRVELTGVPAAVDRVLSLAGRTSVLPRVDAFEVPAAGSRSFVGDPRLGGAVAGG